MDRTIDYFTEDELNKIPDQDLPLAVLSSNATSPFAFGIMNIRKSVWNHFMWMHKPGMFATQDLTYREVPIKKYLGFEHRLKLWHNPNWTIQEKNAIIRQINIWLDKPSYSTRYDWIALVGQALKLVWIENPATRICSDYGSFLKDSGVDPEYNLKYPAPDQVDEWFNSHSNYKVYGRYAGE